MKIKVKHKTDKECLERYKHYLSHLHTAKCKGRCAPHKPILMLSLISLIEKGIIVSPKIQLTDELVVEFNTLWNSYPDATSSFTSDIGKPFFHMHHEPFWHLAEKGEEYDIQKESVQNIKKESKKLPSRGYSIMTLRKNFEYAEIPEDLFLLLKNDHSRGILREALINIYLKPNRGIQLDTPTLISITTSILSLFVS